MQINQRFYLSATIMVIAITLYLFIYRTNYHTVIKGELYRGAFLSEATLKDKITQDKLATIINLCPERDDAIEKGICLSKNVRYVYLPLNGSKEPDKEETEKLLEAFTASPKPMLIHCKQGADRTGYAVALFLYKIKGLKKTDALKALSYKYGYLPALFPWTRGFRYAIEKME